MNPCQNEHDETTLEANNLVALTGGSMQPVIVFLRMRAQELMQIAKSSTNKDIVERLEAMSQEMMDMATYLEASG